MDEHKNERTGRLEVSRLTPSGRGAVSCVGVRGENAWVLFRERWSRADGQESGGEFDRWTEASSSRPFFGLFRFDEIGGVSDEIVLHRRTPNSFEIFGHGGNVVTSRLIEYFVERGAAVVDGDRWERAVRAEESGKTFGEETLDGGELAEKQVAKQIDELFYAASESLLTHATTERIAKIAISQQTLQREFFTRYARFFGAATELEAAESELSRDENEFYDALETVLESGRWGRWLLKPITVSLLGAPNVGKSSLLNSVLGYDRAVVSPMQGTTRDLVAAPLVLDGWNFSFVDAAGLRATDDAIEAEGARLAAQNALNADVVFKVYDCTKSRAEQDEAFAQFLSGSAREIDAKTLFVLNKVDLPKSEWALDWIAPDGSLSAQVSYIEISAKSASGLETLFNSLLRKVFPQGVDESCALALWTSEQIDFLKRFARKDARYRQ